jgi:hypothetical protein
MVHFDLADPTLIPGQPGCVASPRAGRPPLADAKPVKGDADWGGITFIGPLLQNYTVGAPAVLRRTSNGKLWYAAGGYPGTGYEAGAGAERGEKADAGRAGARGPRPGRSARSPRARARASAAPTARRKRRAVLRRAHRFVRDLNT